MVKLASARECRQYGPSSSKAAWEYINASFYVVAAILLLVGFVLQLPRYHVQAGLILLLIAFGNILIVNLHDLFAHLAGIDYRLPLLNLDRQFGLVELASPLVQAVGAAMFFVGILILVLEEEHGFDYKLERHALGLLIAGPVLWLLGSIHNAFQVYERADAQVQALQKAVYLPFLMASVLYLMAGILNRESHSRRTSTELQVQTSLWLAIAGSVLLILGGVFNLLKIFRVWQTDGRLEKLRGGLQERLTREREGRMPLLLEEQMRKRQADPQIEGTTVQTYKDAVVRS